MCRIYLLAALLLLFFVPTTPKKGGGGGRSGGGHASRSSGSSSGSGGRSSSGGTSHSSGSSYGGSSSGGSKGLSSGSSRTIAAALGGAAVGYVAGRAQSHVIGTSSVLLPGYHRTYYYGSSYYRHTGGTTCRYDINDDDDVFNLQFSDGSRVTDITYECSSSSEYCCNGLDCCKKMLPWWAILVIVLTVVGVLICLACACIRCVKRNADSSSDLKNTTTTITSPQVSTAHTQVSHFFPNQPATNYEVFAPTYAQMRFQTPYLYDGNQTKDGLEIPQPPIYQIPPPYPPPPQYQQEYIVKT